MRNIRFSLLSLLLAALSFTAYAQNEARPGTLADTTPPVLGTAPDVGFEVVQDLLDNEGWESINTSDDAANATNGIWFQGNPTVFLAQEGADDSYAAANFNATAGTMISMWLLAPDVGFLDAVTFYTRTATASTFPDGMEVRFSEVGGSNVGTDVTTFGDYTILLEDINTALVASGYPEDWTEFTVNPNTSGRLAFRYLVDNDAGPTGNNSNFIGVDSVSFTIGTAPVISVPTLSFAGLVVLLMVVMGAAMIGLRKRHNAI